MHSTPATLIPESESNEQPGTQKKATKRRPPKGGGGPGGCGWMAIAGDVVLVNIFCVDRGRGITTLGSRRNAYSLRARLRDRFCGSREPPKRCSRAPFSPSAGGGSRFRTLTIIHLAPAGSRVKQGDLLVEFDRQPQMRDFVDKQADYAKLVDQVAGEQAKENAARAKDETELKAADDNLHKAELEIQKAEIESRIDAEKKQEDLDEAKATFDQLRQTFDLKRKAALAAIRILEIQRDRTQQTMLHAQANADLMQIKSPLDGVVVLNTIWKQGTMGEVQEGDQVRPGVPFMQVINPSTMQVRVMANQQDFPAIRN